MITVTVMLVIALAKQDYWMLGAILVGVMVDIQWALQIDKQNKEDEE